jgi:hypothetical protein
MPRDSALTRVVGAIVVERISSFGKVNPSTSSATTKATGHGDQTSRARRRTLPPAVRGRSSTKMRSFGAAQGAMPSVTS